MPTHCSILSFHAVDDRCSTISFPPMLFERGMARLNESGYRTLTLAQVAGHLRGRVPFPERCFSITFDEGYRSVYDEAFPVLERYGFSATVFLTAGKRRIRNDSHRLPSICERAMLSWREIREMHAKGIGFGGHTMARPALARGRETQLEIEIVKRKILIEDALGAEVTTFAYPSGRYNGRCRDIVSRYFACACSDRLGLVHTNSDPYGMERVDAYYLRNEKLLGAIHTAFFPFYTNGRQMPGSPGVFGPPSDRSAESGSDTKTIFQEGE